MVSCRDRLKISPRAKREAERALKRRKKLPESSKFGLDPKEAKGMGITSGVSRARQIIRKDSFPLSEAREIASFHRRFRNKTGKRAESAIDLWGGRTWGKKSIMFADARKKLDCK